MNKAQSFFSHLLLFMVVEIIFIFLLFHEFPHIDVFSALGIGHVVYRATVLIAGTLRVRLQSVRKRFLADYLPVVVHFAVHVGAGVIAFEAHADEAWHEPHNTMRILIGMMGLGILIYRWELLLHRKYHCDTHHTHAHQDCLAHGHTDCEKEDIPPTPSSPSEKAEQ